MATTTNFGWETPDDTDLVKDGAAAMRTLGNSIDTSFVDLKGGTTGQVLSKASGTDLDFTWVAQDDSNAIQNAIVDAKGDLIAATAADTPARLAVGANGQILSADSTAATGLAWIAAPISGGMTEIASGSIANSATGFSLTSIAGTYKNLQLVIRNSYSNADINSKIRVNNLSTSIYAQIQQIGFGATVTNTADASTLITLDYYNSSKAANTSMYVIDFFDYAGNAYKTGQVTAYHQDRATGSYAVVNMSIGIRLTTAIDRIDFITGNANTFAAAGTYTLYGVK